MCCWYLAPYSGAACSAAGALLSPPTMALACAATLPLGCHSPCIYNIFTAGQSLCHANLVHKRARSDCFTALSIDWHLRQLSRQQLVLDIMAAGRCQVAQRALE